MSDQPVLYIAGIGVVTPVGGNVAMTAAAVNAGVSSYQRSRFRNKNKDPITMAMLPLELYSEIKAEIDEGDYYNEQHDHIIKMGILAIHEACSSQSISEAVPLILAMPEVLGVVDTIPVAALINNLAHNCRAWVSSKSTSSIQSGRAAGMEAIDAAFNQAFTADDDFFLVGGSDAYGDYSRLTPLDAQARLLAPDSQDGFAPGEGAGFLLLTCKPELAMEREGSIVALHKPGIAEEPGHWHSDDAYHGDGLDQAFKHALVNHQQQNIHSIYSSMNGENYWAKELGLAQIRNRPSFRENVTIQHPADCYGDLGAATAPILIALAAEHLFKHVDAKAHLVYSSSDTAKRGAIVVAKQDPVARS